MRLSGERSFLFPPGIAALLGALFSTMFGTAFLMVNASPVLLKLTTPEDQTHAELIGVQLGWIVPCVLGLITAHGIPYASLLWRRVVDVELAGALVMLALNFNDEMRRREFAVACGLLFIAFVVVRSVAFAMSVLFRQRVRARREAHIAQQRAARDEILKR